LDAPFLKIFFGGLRSALRISPSRKEKPVHYPPET
jgi:hypothetical protein